MREAPLTIRPARGRVGRVVRRRAKGGTFDPAAPMVAARI